MDYNVNASLIANLTYNNITKIYAIPGTDNIEKLIMQLLGYNASQITPSVYWESAALGGVWGNFSSSLIGNVSYVLHPFNFSQSNSTESTEYDTIIKLYNVSDYYTTYPPSDNTTMTLTSSVINSSINYAYLKMYVNSYKTKLVSNYTYSGNSSNGSTEIFWTKTIENYSFYANLTFTVYYDDVETNHTFTSQFFGNFEYIHTHVKIVNGNYTQCYDNSTTIPHVELVKYQYKHSVPGGYFTFYPGANITFNFSISYSPYYSYLHEYEYNVKVGLKVIVYNGTCPYTTIHINVHWMNGSVSQISKVYKQRQIKIDETLNEWSINPALVNISIVTYDHILFGSHNITREWHAVSSLINSSQK